MTIFKIWQEDNLLKIQLFLKATRSGREEGNNVNKLRRMATVQLSEEMNWFLRFKYNMYVLKYIKLFECILFNDIQIFQLFVLF